MVKLIGLIRRRPEIELAEFYRIWREDLPPRVKKLPGLRAYRQNHAVPRAKGWPWDGVAELWFDDRDAVGQALASPAGVDLIAFERTFIGETEVLIAQEHEVWEERDLPS
ncbi:EthD family reductase [Smaragdicoccus niigatensis]|uniref:EthD family reductase n=1 Tax=Smaragdicoccus niigatensis TaxID=359359 RepID=UPI00036E5411|nr:EthD family reductase [Smaragdicoccus niigatensis]